MTLTCRAGSIGSMTVFDKLPIGYVGPDSPAQKPEWRQCEAQLPFKGLTFNCLSGREAGRHTTWPTVRYLMSLSDVQETGLSGAARTAPGRLGEVAKGSFVDPGS